MVGILIKMINTVYLLLIEVNVWFPVLINCKSKVLGFEAVSLNDILQLDILHVLFRQNLKPKDDVFIMM